MSDLPKISVFTLGCKVNQYDTDAMLAVFEHAGFEITEGLDFADVYIVNTCAVTAEAEKKSRQSVARILKVNPNACIYVCGCASQNNFSQFAKNNVEYISGTDGKVGFARKIAEKYLNGERFDKIVPDRFDISKEYEDNEGIVNLKTRHFIKVQDGCNNFCSYCLIPYVRGRSRSRSVDSVVAELEGVKNVAKEIVVTGINLSAFGKDNGSSLTELMNALSRFDFAVRLGSLEVGVITKDFLDSTKRIKRFCPHFHLSLQSGDDGVLKAMNRHYDTKQYYNAVKLIREYYPDCAITTDIIVGFPSETEEQFANSMAFARKVGFSDVHVFPYSSRRGTVAGRMQPLSPDVVSARQKAMSAVKSELVGNYLNKQLGMPISVLFETCENGVWGGHSPNYVKVYSAQGARNEVRQVVPTHKYLDGIADDSVK